MNLHTKTRLDTYESNVNYFGTERLLLCLASQFISIYCNERDMSALSPYYDKFTLQGGFILDMGVHFIAGLRMVHVPCFSYTKSCTASGFCK